jgi:putative membrane protein
MRENPLLIMIKGICIGGTMLIPGVSGGTMAMVLGIYDKLVSSIASFMKHKKKNVSFLGIFLIGSILGMIIFARPLLLLLERYPLPMSYFFIGLVAGSIPMIFKKAAIQMISGKIVYYPAIGMAMVMLISSLPRGTFIFHPEAGIIYFLQLAAVGAVAAVALVLPGISVSYVLLVIGMYDETMRAISEVFLPFLAPLAAGLALGIFSFAKVLEQALIKHPQPTYLIILGFILASIIKVFQGIPTGWELILCLILLLAGFAAIRVLLGIK